MGVSLVVQHSAVEASRLKLFSTFGLRFGTCHCVSRIDAPRFRPQNHVGLPVYCRKTSPAHSLPLSVV